VSSPAGHPSFREAVGTWVRVGLLSFGGPAGQIAVMHRILVEEKRWIGEGRFLHALNYCMLLPGPEAQQLATYIGWLLHRVRGGLVAGVLFVLPGFVSILVLSVLYAVFQETTLVQALFFGLKPAVVAVVVEAVLRIGRRALKGRAMAAIATGAFVAIFFFQVPFPLIVLTAGLVGYGLWRIQPDSVPGAQADGRASVDAAGSLVLREIPRPSAAHALRTAALCLIVWWTPVALAVLLLGGGSVWVQAALFFSQAAVVTFGGAYAVLAYVAQRAVETFQWLTPGEMLDGLGMAETTPGPLIMVVQFVGFMAAFRNPGSLDPVAAAVIGSALTTWVTFAPSFLFIFVGAPWIEHLRGRRDLSAALSGITAAVVGVILNLALWFGLHVWFARVREVPALGARFLVPDWSTLDPAALAITAGASAALFWAQWGMARTLLLGGGVGLAYRLLT